MYLQIIVIFIFISSSKTSEDVFQCYDNCSLISYKCTGNNFCHWKCQSYASCLGAKIFCEDFSQCQIDCIGPYSCINLEAYSSSQSWFNVTCFGNQTCWYNNFSQGNFVNNSMNSTINCVAPLTCAGQPKPLKVEYICENCLLKVPSSQRGPTTLLGATKAYIIHLFGNHNISVLNSLVNGKGVFQILHKPAKISEAEKISILHDFLNFIQEEYSVNASGVAMTMKTISEDLSFALSEKPGELTDVLLNLYFNSLIPSFPVIKSVEEIYTEIIDENLTTTFELKHDPLPTFLLEFLRVRIEEIGKTFYATPTSVSYVTNSFSNYSIWEMTVEADCQYPQPFWDGIFCSNGQWLSKDKITIIYPDYISSISPSVHTGTLTVQSSFTVASNFTVDKLILDNSSKLTISNGTIQLCSAELGGSVNIIGNIPSSGFVIATMENTCTNFSGGFDKIFVNGTELACFHLSSQLSAIYILPCTTETSPITSPVIIGVVVGSLSAAVIIGSVIIIVRQVTLKKEHLKFTSTHSNLAD